MKELPGFFMRLRPGFSPPLHDRTRFLMDYKGTGRSRMLGTHNLRVRRWGMGVNEMDGEMQKQVTGRSHVQMTFLDKMISALKCTISSIPIFESIFGPPGASCRRNMPLGSSRPAAEVRMGQHQPKPNFQHPPDLHRHQPESWPKITSAVGNCKNIM